MQHEKLLFLDRPDGPRRTFALHRAVFAGVPHLLAGPAEAVFPIDFWMRTFELLVSAPTVRAHTWPSVVTSRRSVARSSTALCAAAHPTRPSGPNRHQLLQQLVSLVKLGDR